MSTQDEELHRSQSSNVQLEDTKHLIENTEIDNLLDSINEQRSSEAKPKTKKKKLRLSQIKKHQSVFTKTEKRLDSGSTFGVSTNGLVQDGSSQDEESKGHGTPKVSKGKKKIKKSKHKKMKQIKFGASLDNDIPSLEDYAPAQQISLFKQNSTSENGDESPPRPSLRVSVFASRTDNYKFAKCEDLCKSAKVNLKRKSSPLGRTYDILRDTDKTKRKVSTSSSSDGEFDRAEDNVDSTAASGKQQYSRLSSSENTTNAYDKSYGLTVSPFEEVVEAKEGEESSPSMPRSKIRRDSMTEDLDGMRALFGSAGILGKNLAASASTKKKSVKVSKSKLLLRQ